MSAIASFATLNVAKLEDARQSRDVRAFLKTHAIFLPDYKWSGYVLVPLLVFLEERASVVLMRSSYDDFANFLSESLGCTAFVLTQEQRGMYLAKLEASGFSSEELERFYNEFNETLESGVGKAMLDGITALRDALKAAGESTVVVLTIG